MMRSRWSTRWQPADRSVGRVEELVRRGRRVMIANRLLLGALICTTVSLGLWLALFLADNAFHLPSGLRLALTIAAVAGIGWLLWRFVIEPLLWPQSLEEAALTLERLFEVPENLVINGLCFEGREFHGNERLFAGRTVQGALEGMPVGDLGTLWEKRRIARWAAPIVVALFLWLLYLAGSGRQAGNALRRYLLPLSDTPPAGSLTLAIEPDTDVTVFEGDDLTVIAKVGDGSETLHSYPQIVWREDGAKIDPAGRAGQTATLKANATRSGEFQYVFEKVSRPFAFRVFAGDTYSSSVEVSVSRIPRIAESHFRVTAPAYTGLEDFDSLGPPEPLSGFPGSEVLVTLRLDKQADRLLWKTGDQRIEFEKSGDEWQARTRLREPGRYEIHCRPTGMEAEVMIASGAILVQQDGAPQVAFDRDRLLVDPGQRVHLGIRASDDYGLQDLQVTVKEDSPAGESRVLETWSYTGPPGEKGPVEETLLLSIDSDRFRPGGTYILQGQAHDFSPQNNLGRSAPLVLQVRSLEDLTVSDKDPAGAAFAALNRAIQAQQRAVGTTRNLLANLTDVLAQTGPDRQAAGSLDQHRDELSRRQEKVGQHMQEVWEVSTEPRPHFVHRVAALRDHEQKQAMDRIASVAQDSGPDPEAAARASLESVEPLQAHILDQLIALKGGYARLQEAETAEAAEEMLGFVDEPAPVVEDEVETFMRELEAFARDQKEIMHDRQMIADLPPEDLTDPHERRMEELALDQSSLAEIIADAVNDFTNLDLQDFGDGAMVEEFKSVFEQAEELAQTAAEAADMRQAREDAYRLETQAVEMAEEILINCEATMGYRDNIQFIAEVPEDEQLVAPLAELPWELEDLVGDLITSEEEMRPEVEDIGSYLNSLDHTAGPIADGTISSMSAKGKTGDQRPEDNIIQGRSGAGRSGMSDGQLVESVAKDLSDNEYGLRERTSNTPLESGRVQDEDVGAQTGGTGLGKASDGSAPFGVAGRLPAKVLDMMTETLERQAEIRRSAQEIVAKLDRHNLPVAELEQSIAGMQSVEEALRAGDGLAVQSDYAETVGTLRRSRRAIGRQVALQHTSDAELARRLEQLQSARDALRFKGYERIISAYFEALAEGNQKGASP